MSFLSLNFYSKDITALTQITSIVIIKTFN